MAAVPALPDSERRTRYTISAATGPYSVGFDVYGNSTDYAQWLEVWDDGVKLTAVTDWTLDSPSGSLATLARPITDARITFTTARTGDIDIVGADRPRRASQLTEGVGVSVRDFNQAITQIIARLREVWDTLKTRTLYGRPGEAVDMTLPAIADRAGKFFKWDSDGKPSYESDPDLGGGTLTNNAVSNSYLRDSGACSVIGRSANSSGDPADISAAANNTFLGRVSDALAYFTVTAMLDLLASTRGMLMLRGASAWAGLAIGTSGYVLTSNGTDAAWASPVAQLPRGYIDGCTLSNSSGDATNDISIAAGVCRDSTNAVNITVAAFATGKQLDANWAAGDAAGMRDSSAAITNTTYHLYAAVKADGTQDIYATTQATAAGALTALQAESGGTDYVYARRIGSILRESAAIVAFQQFDDEFIRTSPKNETVSTAFSTTQTNYTISVPTGIRVIAEVTIQARQAGAELTIAAANPNVTIALPAVSSNGISSDSNPVDGAASTLGTGFVIHKRIRTNASAQIAVRASGTTSSHRIQTFEWFDRREKDAA